MRDDSARHLPHSANRLGLSPRDYRAAMECTLPIAVEHGTDIPKADLAAIQAAGNLPAKHTLLADNQELYEEALRYAFAVLWPYDLEAFEAHVATLTPVPAMRKLVGDTVQRAHENPDATRLIAAENLLNRANLLSRMDVLEQSPVILQIDKALLRGRDLGAFRTGVSAEDVYVLILSLSSFATLHRTNFYALYGMDTAADYNAKGLRDLACDTVIAFLTTPMDSSQQNSYTHSSPSDLVGESVAASLYDSVDIWQQ